MDAEFKAKWVAALRSGKYRQGVGYLNRSGEYCCLGVACDLLAKEGRGEWNSFGDSSTFTLGEWPESGVLPEDAAGIIFGDRNNTPGFVKGMVDRPSLTQLNDEGFTFDQIADIVDYFF